MGRGRRVGSIGSIVPPPGFRWAPKPNAFARCVGNGLYGGHGGRTAFVAAVDKCRGTRGS